MEPVMRQNLRREGYLLCKFGSIWPFVAPLGGASEEGGAFVSLEQSTDCHVVCQTYQSVLGRGNLQPSRRPCR